MAIFGCNRTKTRPCVKVDLIRPNCDIHRLDVFQLFGKPSFDGLTTGTLSFLSDDIPSEYLNCCTQVRARLDWEEYRVFDYPIFDGVLIKEQRDRVLNFSTDSVEWEIGSLTTAIDATVIAYIEGSPEAFKSSTVVEATYEYLIENLIANVTQRGDGSICATRELACIQIDAPTSLQIADSEVWEGDRHGDNLLETVTKALAIDGLYLQSVLDESDDLGCCYKCRFYFGTLGRERSTILSPCLQNAEITRIIRNCDNYDVVHVFGVVDDGSGNEVQQIVTECLSDNDSVQTKCTRETSIKLTDVQTLESMRTHGQEFLNAQPPSEILTFDTNWDCSFRPLIDLEVGDVVQLIDDDDTQRTVRVSQMPFLVVDDLLVQIGATFEVINEQL